MKLKQVGFTLLETLVTLVIVTFGLLGLVALIAKFSSAQMESYQRAHALLIVQNIADTLRLDLLNSASYVNADIPGSLGAGCSEAGKGKDANLCNWAKALIGAGERVGGSSIGSLVGGRACITQPSANVLTVEVAWQGLSATAAPGGDCGKGQYGDDSFRRVVSISIFKS